MSVIGRFYFKQTKNGNLIGEFSNNHTNENITECANIKSEFDKNNKFIGNYETVWMESKANFLILKIEYKTVNKQIFKLTWSNSNKIIFYGEGFIVDKILIGDYRDFE
jgi:hypothetical protein